MLLFSTFASTASGQLIPLPTFGKSGKYADKLYHKATPIPDRVILTWAGDPATSQSVTWRTDVTVKMPAGQIALSEAGPGFARGKLDGSDSKVRSVPATSVALTTDLGECLQHSVNFDALTPATRYVYRVGDGANWSEWFQFTTPSEQPAPLRFLYFGDAQTELKQHWSRVVRGAYSDMPKAHFILHAGDLVNRGAADGEWGEWFQAAGWINGMVPTIPTPGNHEYSGSRVVQVEGKNTTQRVLTGHWRPQFALPTNGPPGLEETAYYLDIQGVRVVSLNSNEKRPEQKEWLDGVLQSNPHRWTVVTFHHPVYSTAKGRDNKELRELWRPVLEKHGVDLVLTGHDHTYGRSGLMREDNLTTGATVADKGIVYVVSVSGPKMYSLDPEPWMASRAKDTQLYQLITIDGDRLSYEARTATGKLYDEFELRKRPDGSNAMVERSSLDAERATVPTEPRPTRSQLIIAVAAMLGLTAFVAVVKAGRWWTRARAV